jgi:hypothetical protein
MALYKTIKDLADRSGVMSVTPAGIAANVISKAVTGKTPLQHFAGQITGPATGSGNVGRDKKGDVISEGGSFRDPQQKKTLRGRNARGGLISHKSVFDLE